MVKKDSGAGHGSKVYQQKMNFCFGCGRDNLHGMHLKFSVDPESQSFVSNFRLSRRYTGPPGHCHGGIIATILDESMSKLSKLRDIVAATSQMQVEYLRPVPLHSPLRVESREISKRGRRLVRAAEIIDENGTVLARARGVFVIIDPHRVFFRRE